jgi:hypothetical protein
MTISWKTKRFESTCWTYNNRGVWTIPHSMVSYTYTTTNSWAEAGRGLGLFVCQFYVQRNHYILSIQDLLMDTNIEFSVNMQSALHTSKSQCSQRWSYRPISSLRIVSLVTRNYVKHAFWIWRYLYQGFHRSRPRPFLKISNLDFKSPHIPSPSKAYMK